MCVVCIDIVDLTIHLFIIRTCISCHCYHTHCILVYNYVYTFSYQHVHTYLLYYTLCIPTSVAHWEGEVSGERGDTVHKTYVLKTGACECVYPCTYCT